jgi:hypothetical protein
MEELEEYCKQNDIAFSGIIRYGKDSHILLKLHDGYTYRRSWAGLPDEICLKEALTDLKKYQLKS